MGIERVAADYMGMLATVINGMALQSALKSAGLESRLQTALSLEQAAAPYVREKANRHLESGRVMIFAGGTGNPFFTTDTAAALRAAEIGACALLKATRVDGVYSSDPNIEKDAVKYDSLTFDEAISRKLRVMGRDGFYAVPRSQFADRGVQPFSARRAFAGRSGRERRHAGFELTPLTAKTRLQTAKNNRCADARRVRLRRLMKCEIRRPRRRFRNRRANDTNRGRSRPRPIRAGA